MKVVENVLETSKLSLSELSDKEYRSLNFESFSSIKHMLDSPETFKHYKEKPFKGSLATLLGTCIHHYLQGNKHLVWFQQLSNTKKNAEAIFEFKKQWIDMVGEEGLVVPKTFEPKLDSILMNLNKNKEVLKLLNGCEFEKAYTFYVDGLMLKGKLDGVGSDYILEIKSSGQATSAEEFKKEAYDRHYDLQAYLYQKAALKSDHYFIVVNTQEPFKVSLYKSSKEFMESGKTKALLAVDRYKKYILGGEEWNSGKRIEEI